MSLKLWLPILLLFAAAPASACEDPPVRIAFERRSAVLSAEAKAKLDMALIDLWTARGGEKGLRLAGGSAGRSAPARALRHRRLEAVKAYVVYRGLRADRIDVDRSPGSGDAVLVESQ